MKNGFRWIDGPWRGRVAISPHPFGGVWLEDEIVLWQNAGVDVVVSLLGPEEVTALDLSAEKQHCNSHGLEFVSFPIPDMGTPASQTVAIDLAKKLQTAVSQGKNVLIHCMAGIGRSTMIAASLLIAAGTDPTVAIKRISAARGCRVPETSEQREWIYSLPAELLRTSVER